MIVHCEHCSAAYQVEAEKIPEEGLALSCSACHGTFKVIRKTIFVVEPFSAQGAPAPAAANPAPEETSASNTTSQRKAVSEPAPGKKSPLMRTMRTMHIPGLRLRQQLSNDPKEGSFWTAAIFGILLVGAGLLLWKGIAPAQFDRAWDDVSNLNASVSQKIEPLSTIRKEAKQAYLLGRGESVLDTEDHYLKAVEQYRAAIASEPTYAAAYGALSEAAAELAELYQSRNQETESRQWMDEILRSGTKAVTLDANCLEGMRGMIAYDRLQGRLVQAQGQINLLIGKNPTDSELYVALARTYLGKQGLEDVAKEYLLKAVALNERSIRAHRYLAAVEERLDHPGEALDHWQRVLDLFGEHELARSEVARLSVLTEVSSKAREVQKSKEEN